MEKSPLKWGTLIDYTPAKTSDMSRAELSKEYSRLRSIARKRLERMANSEWNTSRTYKENVGQYEPVAQLSTTMLRYKLAQISRFVDAKSGSISGLVRIRKEAIESLQLSGYDFITVKNFDAFVEFMEEFKAQKLSEMYDSDRVVELFNVIQKRSISVDEVYNNFEGWIDKADELMRTPTPVSTHPKSSQYYKKKLGI